MNLDINTPRGQRSLLDEQVMLTAIERKYKSLVIQTPKEREAKCDGIITKDNIMRSVFESKCRYNLQYDLETNKMSVDVRSGSMDCTSWLITHDKIVQGQYMSEMLCVPFVGLLYIVSSGVVLSWKITDATGRLIINTNEQVTKTQYSINGGTAVRNNAYLNLSDSVVMITPEELHA
jgi:hypothetical protein